MHKTISFVRHGQYEHHPGVFGGMLTEKGSEQAMRTAEEMIRRGATKVIASDYQRAIDTAGFIEMAMSVMHGSVTTFSVSENLTRVIEVGACTHLPMRLRTA